MAPLNDEEIMRVHRSCVARLPQLLKANNCKFGGHATQTEISQAEKRLRVKFPYELAQMLLVSDGVLGPAEEPWIWSLEKIVAENFAMRANTAHADVYMPFSNLLFFGGQEGSLFAYSVHEKICGLLFEWKEESDDRINRGLCLDDFFTKLIDNNGWRNGISAINPLDINSAQKSCIPKLAESCSFGIAASEEDIRYAEGAVGVDFHNELRDLYKVANGIHHRNGTILLYSLERLIAENKSMRRDDIREIYMPFDPLLFFAAEGNGDLYAFRILKGRVDNRVFEWDHESDERLSVSNSLSGFYAHLLEFNKIS